MKLSKNKKGFSLVEILLAIAVFVTSCTATIYLLIDASSSNQRGEDRITATTMAETGMEAARNIRDSNWESLSVGNHGVAIINGQLSFSGESDTDESNRFTRQVTVSNISDDKKLVVSNVSWSSPYLSQLNITLSSYLTNWKKVTAVPPSWDSPSILGSGNTQAQNADGNPYDIFVLGNYAYLSTNRSNDTNASFFIFDITNPTTPTLVGSSDTGKKAYGVFISGEYAYLATQQTDSTNPELVVIKITNPAEPTIVARVDIAGNAFAKDIAVFGHYAYLTTFNNTGGSEVVILDVTDPEHPINTPVGSLEIDNDVNSISISDDLAYIATADDTKEIQVININNKTAPEIVGAYNNPGPADGLDVLISGTNLYLTTRENGATDPNFSILSVDTSNLENITITGVGQMQISGADLNGLALDNTNNQIYLAGTLADQEFMVIDISNPALPVIKAGIDLPGAATAIAYNGANVFLADNTPTQQLIIIGPSS